MQRVTLVRYTTKPTAPPRTTLSRAVFTELHEKAVRSPTGCSRRPMG